jgi:hypothetical protein
MEISVEIEEMILFLYFKTVDVQFDRFLSAIKETFFEAWRGIPSSTVRDAERQVMKKKKLA